MDIIPIPDEEVNYVSDDDSDSGLEEPVHNGGQEPVEPQIETKKSNRLRSHNSASGMSQKDLRETIRKLQRNDSLGAMEKARRIQALMTTSWRETQKEKEERQKSMRNLQMEENDKPEKDEAENYKNFYSKNENLEEENIYGCRHYKRGCNISAPCCDKFYPCRFCHDENSDHGIDRYSVNRIQCMECGTQQNVNSSCEKCGFHFARYFCEPCKFFDDSEDKDIYHCPYCNICRIGKGLGIDYFHCSRCNACMSITLKEHKCVERSLESNCPVCHEFMFTSTTPVMFLPCGHCMHVNCYEEYTSTNYVCPICSKSLGNMSPYFKRIDEMLKTEKMPPEFEGLRNRIFCADCEKRSIAPFHFLYHKCTWCESYNTKVLEQLPKIEPKSSGSRSARVR